MQDDYQDNFLAEEDMQNNDDVPQASTQEETENGQKKSSISADLIRGHINTIILRSLYEGDRYGYDIINEIEQKSHGQYTLKQPTLYSALKRLESQGYVKSYWGGVSNGGRRRYFSLTEEGRSVSEKNQAEWEYSRTIIDSLISQNDFDFTNPAPEKLDFRILRQATSRTPIIREEEEESENARIFANEPLSPDKNLQAEPNAEIIQTPANPTENLSTSPAVDTLNSAPITQSVDAIQSADAQQEMLVQQTTPAQQEILIQQEVAAPQDFSAQQTTPAPITNEVLAAQSAENTPTRPLPLFLTKSEEERNYKEILSRIYKATIKEPQPVAPSVEATAEYAPTQAETPSDPLTQGVAPTEEPPIYKEEQAPQLQYAAEPEQRINAVKTSAYDDVSVIHEEKKAPLISSRIDFSDVKEQALYDGLRVWTAGGAGQKKEMPEDFFNKGLALLKASLVFFLVAITETVLVLIFKEVWLIETWYLFIMFGATCLPPIICGILYLAKYQPCRKRLKNNAAVYNGIVTFIATFILLVAAVLFADVDLMNYTALMAYLVIPFIYLLNVLVFAVSYYFLSRSKI